MIAVDGLTYGLNLVCTTTASACATTTTTTTTAAAAAAAAAAAVAAAAPGNYGYQWQSASISSVGYECLRFKAVTGSSYKSDFALDDITVYLGANGCE